MATVKDITTMCRAGNVMEAYEIAQADLNASPQDIWTQRKMGWALYYMLKMDVEYKDSSVFINHVEELMNLDLLTITSDSLIFDNVLWKIAEFIKNIPSESVNEEMDKLFSLLRNFTFTPSKGYSYLLKSCLHLETWAHLVEFFEWWNLDNLLPDDYQQFKLENGRKIMSLAEQVYIAYSKALLRQNDKNKIHEFLPKIEKLMEDNPSMIYPGYFCGKLMLATGAAKEDALNIVMPFVRKKQSEFWIWQLLSEIYNEDADICLACLLRAVHSNTQETFLGKIRMKLAFIYLSHKDYRRAKYHLDKMQQSYIQQGWHLPYEVQNWLKESWMQKTVADGSDSINYKQITDAILLNGTNESLAVVTHIDNVSKRAILVYGERMRAVVKLQKLNGKMFDGSILKINWIPTHDGQIDILGSVLVDQKTFVGNTYIKHLNGRILKPENKSFAFIEGQGIKCFITPKMVEKYHLNGGELVTVIAAFNFNKKRNEWSWMCVSIKVQNNTPDNC